MVDGRLAAIGRIDDLRAAMTDKPRQVRIGTDRPRDLAAALMIVGGVDGVHLRDGIVDVTTTDPTTLAHALPRLARDSDIKLFEVAPADESMEQVFRYLVESGS
jgi:ABC-2 type transport system ATP-binding protein